MPPCCAALYKPIAVVWSTSRPHLSHTLETIPRLPSLNLQGIYCQTYIYGGYSCNKNILWSRDEKKVFMIVYLSTSYHSTFPPCSAAVLNCAAPHPLQFHSIAWCASKPLLTADQHTNPSQLTSPYLFSILNVPTYVLLHRDHTLTSMANLEFFTKLL